MHSLDQYNKIMAYQILALKGYNSSSCWQLSNMLNNIDEVLSNLISVSKLTDGPIKIVDYGCSEGLNTSIFFYELIKRFRNTSDQCIEILHNDLPNNDWSVFYNTINNNDPSHIKLNNVYYSALGKSFYEDITMPRTVHLAYSAHSFHYLSQRSVRKEGEKGMMHSAFFEKTRKDMETLIGKRINELTSGGIFNGLFTAISEQPCESFGKIYIGGFYKLLELSLITQEEFDNFELTSFPIRMAQIDEILQKFSDQIEIIGLKIEKAVSPHYAEYLEDKNIEKYANGIVDFIMILGIANLKTNFPNKNLADAYKEEITKIALACSDEIYYDYINLVIRKK